MELEQNIRSHARETEPPEASPILEPGDLEIHD